MANKFRFIGLLILGGYNYMFAQLESVQTELDPAVKYGILENGVSYYIKSLDKYEGPLRMNFYVMVGQTHEEPEELDFAHALEHLGFRETTNFPNGFTYNNEIMSEVGLYNRNFRGATSGNYTRFVSSVPAENPRARDTVLSWFRDIATEMIVTPESVNRERGVLLQEFAPDELNRDNRRAKFLLESHLFSCVPDVNNFVEQNRIFSSFELERFYKKWYRPDRMVLTVLGNVNDIQNIDKVIEEKFSDIPRAKELLQIPECKELHYKRKSQFSIVKYDLKENLEESDYFIQLEMYFRDPVTSDDFKQGNGIRKIILDDLISILLRNRLSNLTKRYDAFYRSTSLSANKGRVIPNSIKVIIQTERGAEEEAMKEVFYLLQQTTSYGITEEEFVKLKRDYIIDQNIFSGEGMSYWEQEIENLIKRQESLPLGKARELKKWLEDLTLYDYNNVLKEIMSGSPEDIGMLVPEDYVGALDSEMKIRNAIQKALKIPIEPLKIKSPPNELLTLSKKDSLIPAESIKVATDIPDVLKFRLRNGLTVTLKCVPQAKEIYLHGYSKNGSSCFPNQDFNSAHFAPSIIKASGAGIYNKYDLQDFLDTTIKLKNGVFQYIKNYESGVQARGDTKELEYLLQLIYLFFTEPRKDRLAFIDWKRKSIAYAKGRPPLNDFIDLHNELIDKNSGVFIDMPLADGIENVDFDKAYDIYKAIFTNAEDFSFIITGNFEISKILPLIEKYLGNIPISYNSHCVKIEVEKLKIKKGPVLKKIKSSKKDIHGYYSLSFIKPQQMQEDWKYEIKFNLLAAVMQQLIRKLRAEGFSLYHFGVGTNLDRDIKRYEINFNFILLPGEWAQIRKRSFEKIEDVLMGNISEGEFDNAVKTIMERYNQHRLNHPKSVNNALYLKERYNKPWIESSKVEEYILSLDLADIVKMSKKIFLKELRYELVQL